MMPTMEKGSVGAAVVMFEERFEQFYLQLSEGKTGGMVACVDEMQRIVDSIQREPSPGQATAPAAPAAMAAVYEEMLQDCRRKAGEATLERLRKLCQRLGRPGAAGEVDELGAEGMAEEETVVVSYHAALLGRAESAANIYGGFLRNRLKQENDAAVRHLSSVRALYRLSLASGGGGAAIAGVAGGGIIPDGTTAAAAAADPHPHLTALATVLGEGSKLMARLAESSLGQGVEEPVARLLHEDSKSQAVKVLEWFQHDADLPKWQAQVSGGAVGPGKATTSRASPPSSSGNGRSAVGGDMGKNKGRLGGGASTAAIGTEGSVGTSFDARGVDFVIDEMALACQYCQRYLDFVADDLGLREEPTSGFFMQVRVIEGAYVQLEVAYCLRSVEEAMRIAEPIEVQDGTYVSSMVEDASFLVHKSLRRSVSTRSEQAIMAVCNRITEILDPHAPEPSFYGGLATEADHRVPLGAEVSKDDVDLERKRQPDDFSTALAKALDEAENAELRGREPATVAVTRGDDRHGAGAGFGGVEGAMVGINSVHVALSSVSAIQDALDRFLESSNPLVRLMLDEVARILRAYRGLRDSRLNDLLEALYPPVSKALANVFGSSSYAVGPTEYELRSADLPGARRVLNMATQSMVGDEEGAAGDLKGAGGAGGGCCRTALLQEPFEELVRFLARRVADAIEAAVRSKGGQRMGGGNGVNTASVSRGSAMTGTGFTEWGALLLRKEVRTLQQGLASLMETDSLNSEFADINELVRLLNFERPSDAVEYRPPPAPRRPGGSAGSDSRGKDRGLSPERIKEVLRMRVDFQREAIDALDL